MIWEDSLVGVFLQALASILWILAATGWFIGSRLLPGVTGERGFAIFGLAACVAAMSALLLRAQLRRSGAFGALSALGAVLAQVLLVSEDPLWYPAALGAWILPLFPIADFKRDRWHLVAAAVGIASSPFLAGKLALWGAVTLPALETETLLLQSVLWGALFLFAHYAFHQGISPRARLEVTPGGKGGLALSASSDALPSSSPMSLSAVNPSPASSGSFSRAMASGILPPPPPSDMRASGAVPRGKVGWEDPSGMEDVDPSASQVLSRSLLSEQDEQARQQMSKLLGPVVHLMHKVFRAYSALGFLVDPATGDLVLNAKFGKGNVIPDARIMPGQNLLGHAIRSGLLTGDVANYGESPEYYPDGERVLSLMALPVRNEESGDLQALLVVDHKSPRAFSDEHYQYFKRFAGIASALVTVQSARTAVQRQATITNTFYDIQSRLTRHLKAEDLLSVLETALRDLFPLDRIAVSIWNPQRNMAQIQIVSGSVALPARGAYFDATDPSSVVGSVFRTGREILVRQAVEGSHPVFESRLDAEVGWSGEETMAAPLLNDDRQCFGVLTMETSRAGSYAEIDAKLLAAIAAIAAGALTRARMYQEMEKLATIDGLTQVPNHRHFQTLLNQQIEVASRYGQKIGLMLFDIDHFKIFNDTYGHAIGDLVLKEVARSAGGAIRSSDVLARYGGEEFVVLMPQTDTAGAMLSAERVRAAVEAMAIPHDGKTLKVTISIGVCLFPDMAGVKQDFIDGADKAMYFSKKSGRNRVSLYGPESEELAQQKEKVGGGH
jgi:diguanylate cyclase (GGDEF)-like protein